MNNEFVSYEIALKLKELGFDEPSLGRFYTKPKCKMFGIDEEERYYPIKNTPKKLYILGEHFVLNDDNVITAPLYQQVINFLYICSNKQIDIELKGSDTYEERITKIEQGCKDLWNLQNNKSK
jgi:hypothetical protein